MNLTDHQQWIIKEWALRTPHVVEVRLFGSRAKGTAKPDSDIDLAITVGGDELRCRIGQQHIEEPRARGAGPGEEGRRVDARGRRPPDPQEALVTHLVTQWLQARPNRPISP